MPGLPRLHRWPTQCAICRGWGWSRLCAACVALHAPRRHRCARCALPTIDAVPVCGRCLIDPPPYERALAAIDYAHPWDIVIRRFKFHAGLDLAGALADLLHGAARAAPAAPSDLLLAAPVSIERLRERGYNQAWELTRRLARRLRVPAAADILLRVRHTPQQMSLPSIERIGNVRNAFAIEPTRRAALRGRRVALVDDVMTTGATAAEMTRVLLGAGVASVEVWTLARTPSPDG